MIIIMQLFFIFSIFMTIFLVLKIKNINFIKTYIFIICVLILFLWVYFTYNYWNSLNNYFVLLQNLVLLFLLITIIIIIIELNWNYYIWKDINSTDIKTIDKINYIKEKNILLIIRFLNLLFLLVIMFLFFN